MLRPRKDVGKFEKKPKKKKLEKADIPNDKNPNSKKNDTKTDKKPEVKSRDRNKEKSKDKSTSDNEKLVKVQEDDTLDDKKPIGLPVDAINVDDYTAPDPLTVAESLKQDEAIELSEIKELRQKNRQKLIDENIEGPYCLCRKPIEGFMIRCNLCLDWFHTSCICVPKTVHGKPIGKGYTAWSATREVRFLCTLCSRSRRPRLDTILQLLMSLQKLPVRVPEGEALQFLTERAMNWQDRAKQALSDPEIQRVISEAKVLAEKTLSEKQTVSGYGVTQNAILQKLINVQKIHKISLEKMTTQITDVTASITTNNANVIETSNVAEGVLNATTKDAETTDLECTEEMTGSPVTTKPSNSLLENPNVVHLTSADSSRAQSPIDVCTPLENLPSSSGKTAKEMITSSPITMKELPSALLDQLEELMYEGELLEVCLDEVPHIWAILQIQNPLMKENCMVMVSV